MRIKCRWCGCWCGERVTEATPRLRADHPYAGLCRVCAAKYDPPAVMERIGPHLFRWRVNPGQAARKGG